MRKNAVLYNVTKCVHIPKVASCRLLCWRIMHHPNVVSLSSFKAGRTQLKWWYQWKFYTCPLLFLEPAFPHKYWIAETLQATLKVQLYSVVWMDACCAQIWLTILGPGTGSALLLGLISGWFCSAAVWPKCQNTQLNRLWPPGLGHPASCHLSCFRLIHRHTDALAHMEDPSRCILSWLSHLMLLSG